MRASRANRRMLSKEMHQAVEPERRRRRRVVRDPSASSRCAATLSWQAANWRRWLASAQPSSSRGRSTDSTSWVKLNTLSQWQAATSSGAGCSAGEPPPDAAPLAATVQMLQPQSLPPLAVQLLSDAAANSISKGTVRREARRANAAW